MDILLTAVGEGPPAGPKPPKAFKLDARRKSSMRASSRTNLFRAPLANAAKSPARSWRCAKTVGGRVRESPPAGQTTVAKSMEKMPLDVEKGPPCLSGQRMGVVVDVGNYCSQSPESIRSQRRAERHSMSWAAIEQVSCSLPAESCRRSNQPLLLSSGAITA